jgi:putative nucleotidyltransferase with HDIG domain
MASAARILVVHGETHSRARSHGIHDQVPDRIEDSFAVAAVLEHSSYTAVLADGSREAVNRLEDDSPFDAIVSEIVMRGVDGLGLLSRVRQTHPDIPVVILASQGELPIAVSALGNGAYDYLIKPFEPSRLLSTMRRAVEYRRLLLQNAMYRQNLEQLVTARTEMLNQMVADLERSYDITLEALGDALDLKDAETEGHSKRVTAFTIALARNLGLTAEQIRVIARGAFLHDIGKMAIPDAILLKPGGLQSEEQKVMREHCALGYQMLRKIPFLQEAAEIVYSHQERFDGTGYPRGLKGEQIPLGARIFTIADTLDAITSDRPYRKAKSFPTARGEIKRCAGTQFDPKIVASYLNMPDAIWEDLRGEITHHAKRFSPFAFAANAASKLRNPFG